MRTLVTASSAACGAVLLLAGCTSPRAQPAPAPVVITSSASPSPVVPVPAATDASPTSQAPSATTFSAPHDAAGVEAFTRYFFQQVEAAYATGDTSLISAISAEDCASCANYIRDVKETYGAGDHVTGVHVTLSDLAPVVTDYGGAATFSSLEAANATYDSRGVEIAATTAAPPVSLLIVVDYIDGRWRTAEVGPPGR